MTPPDLPLDDGPLDDDTLALHAVVDDEATAEQRRRVARDPELVARVAALRNAVAAVAEPVEPPPADVLAALRQRAVAALDQPDDDLAPADDEDLVVPPPPPPVRDLGTARARRRRQLPPLPAVAAVVVLLVVVGVGLLVAGTSTDDSGDRASSGLAADSDDAAEGGAEATTAGGPDAMSAEDRPADALRDELLARSTARYGSQEDLEADLRRVDVDTLALAGSVPAPTDDASGEAASTTTAPPTTSGGSTEGAGTNASAFASDPVATRCDSVLRAAEPDLDPAVAATLVEVDGVPVLILSNPTEVSDQAPSGLRLTVLNAVDCSPRSAVLR